MLEYFQQGRSGRGGLDTGERGVGSPRVRSKSTYASGKSCEGSRKQNLGEKILGEKILCEKILGEKILGDKYLGLGFQAHR